MPRLPVLAKAPDPVLYLVSRRFPEVTWLQQYAPEDGVKIAPTLGGLAGVGARIGYENELRQLPADQLQALFADERAKEEAERREAAAKELAREVASRFYNQPSAGADVEYWAQQSYWRPDEAVALSLGKDPRIVNWERLKSCTQIWDFAREFEARRQTVSRAVGMGQLYEFSMPTFFLGWARRMKFTMPESIIAAVEAFGNQIGDWKTVYDSQVAVLEEARSHIARLTDALQDAEVRAARLPTAIPSITDRPLGKRERDTIDSILITMAVAGYKYDPDRRTPAVSEILTDALGLGFELSDDVIREKLKAAAELLPGRPEPAAKPRPAKPKSGKR